MLRKIFTTFITITTVYFSSFAQSDSTKPAEASPTPLITGSIDAYYRFNFSDPVPVPGAFITNVNSYTSFTNSHNSFELGMASIRADHSFGKASGTVDLGFGKRAEEFSYGDPANSTLFALKQAYVSYAVSDKFKLTIGKWATHIGYELVDAYLNRNYSMSYMFSYGPFSHTGLKADIGLGAKSALMLGVANNTDVVSTTSSRKFAIAQFSTASSDDKFKAYLNYQGSYADSSSLTQFDLVVTGAVSDKFSIGYNGTVQSIKPYSMDGTSWWGSALYFNLDPTSTFGITLRGEYFDNKKGTSSIAPATSIFEITLSPNIKIGNLIIIPELRYDSGKENIFAKHDGTTTKNTVTGILAATYHF
ncbi:MAG: outer membrane beta-barrel protein [Ginsengibacter sp.]